MEKEIAQKIKEAGGKLYLVGGAVRDEIMGKEPHDKDYCVEGVELKDFTKLFPEAKLKGITFPVFVIDDCEFALARTEKKISEGYKGFNVNASKDITIVEDLRRRDLTINAIAKDVLTDEIIDPFNGISDIKNKKIRHVSDAFDEDPLRAYRVARFAAKYDFDVVPETIEKIKNLKDELTTLSKDRIRDELTKALSTDTPSKFFRILKEAGILDVHFKEINDLVGIPQPEKYHPEGDVFEHSMIVLDKVAAKTPDVSVRFAALVHDLGKAKTPKEILPRHIDHENKAEKPIKDLCNRAGLPNVWEKRGLETASMHMVAASCRQMRPFKQAAFYNHVARTSIGLDNLEMIANADNMIDSKEVKFADLAKQVLSEANGKALISKGITVEKYGTKVFVQKLLESQARLITEIERKEKEVDNDAPEL